MASVNNIVLRKVSFENRVLWMSIPVADKDCLLYAEFVNAAKTRFDLEDLELCDENGVLIDETAFPFFANSVIQIKRLENCSILALDSIDPNIPYQMIETQGESLDQSGFAEFDDEKFVLDDGSESVVVIDTSNKESESIQKVDNQIAPILSDASQVSQSQVTEFVKKLKLMSGGNEILEEYERTSELSTKSRQLLVNLAVQILIDEHGSHPPTSVKTHCAKIIVQQFPSLRDPGTKEGYETFFNAKTHTGFLAYRLKTVNRTLKPSKKMKVEEHPVSNQNNSGEIEQTLSNEEIKDKLNFLSLADPKTEKDGIIQAMIDTFGHRKKHRDVILKEFPRFLDTPYLVKLEFSLMFPNVKVKKFNASKILNVFEKRYNSNAVTKQEVLHGLADKDDWDKDTKAFIALLLMLTCSVKGKPKSERQSSSKKDVSKKLITFAKTGTPLDTIETATSQPCLIVLGPTQTMINSYYVAFEGNFIPLDATSSEDGFRQLLMSHYVFNTSYVEELKYFYQFFQSFYFGLEEKVKFTARMRELRSLLWEEE